MPAVKNVGEPCAGEPHARIDGGREETRSQSATPRDTGRLSPTRPLPTSSPGACSNDRAPAGGGAETLADQREGLMTDLLARSGGSTSVGSFLDVPGEPWDYYVTLREAGDVVWDDRAEAWVVSSHELIRELALAEGDSVEMYPLPGRPVAYPENLSEEVMTETRISSRAIQLLDGKEHDIQHRWWMRAFTPRILNAWRDQWFRPICRAQIDRFVSLARRTWRRNMRSGSSRASSRRIARAMALVPSATMLPWVWRSFSTAGCTKLKKATASAST